MATRPILAGSAGAIADSRTQLPSGDSFCRALLDHSNDGVVVLHGEIFVDCNSQALAAFGIQRGDLIGRPPFDPSFGSFGVKKEFAAKSRDALRRAYAGEPVTIDWRCNRGTAEIRYLEITLTRFALADGLRLLGIVRDVTKKTAARLELEHRQTFRDQLAQLSDRLANVDSDQFDATINRALKRVAIDYAYQRASLWWLDRRRSLSIQGHAWVAADRPPGRRIVPMAQTPEVSRLIVASKELLRIPHDLPETAAVDRAFYKNRGVHFGVLVPLLQSDEFVGVAAFMDTEGGQERVSRDVEETAIFGRLIGTAWFRRDEKRRARRRERSLQRRVLFQAQVAAMSKGLTAWPHDQIGTEIDLVFANIAPQYGIDWCALWQVGKPGKAPAQLHSCVASTVPPDGEVFGPNFRGVDREFPRGRRDAVLPGGTTDLDYSPHCGQSKADPPMLLVRAGTTDRPAWLMGFGRCSGQPCFTGSERADLVVFADLFAAAFAQHTGAETEPKAVPTVPGIIGSSPPMRAALSEVEKAAPTDVTVLLLGETGTGKELFAESLHALSRRCERPLVRVNCAALPTDLIESELFGHEAGAFTGAQKPRKGRFELAHRGTLFLDEIGDLSPEVQAKMLRALQSGEFERLGGSETFHADVRIIAATNRDLRTMVARGEFRDDLYYRINNFPIRLPALRDRPEDIAPLARHFVSKHAADLGRSVTSIAAGMLDYLAAQPWPGNVRELEGFIQRALIASTGSQLDYRERASEMGVRQNPESASAVPLAATDLQTAKRQHIESVLQSCQWVIGGPDGAAARLGLPPSSLRSLMKRLGVARPN